MLIGFVFLFMLAFLLINPVAKKETIKPKAEYFIELEWDGEKPYDLDDPNVKPWTGFGFLQVSEGSELIFDVPGSAIRKDLDYDLVIRHQHQPDSPNQWKEATVQLLLGTIHIFRNHC